MPERYDRAFCTAELLLGNTIIQKVVSVRGLGAAFHLPETVQSDRRVGKRSESLPIANPAGGLPDTSAAVGDGSQAVSPVLGLVCTEGECGELDNQPSPHPESKNTT